MSDLGFKYKANVFSGMREFKTTIGWVGRYGVCLMLS